MVVSSVIHWSF